MMAKTRDYIFYDAAVSICTTCFRRIDAKIVFEDGNVFMLKRCPEHGFERVLMADDVDYYKRCREVFLKKPEMPDHYNTPVKYGCPYDCGLCPDHEQHSCLTLIEICDACNLSCPVCYAESGTHRTTYRSMEEIERMLDAVVSNEIEPDVVQISGGEPSIHPQILDIIRAAKRRPIRHIMLNTNGIRIANDPEFVAALAEMKRGFEVYLQFDALSERALRTIRGADLRRVRERALDALDAAGISTTLVCVIRKDVNDNEIGDVLRYAQLTHACNRLRSRRRLTGPAWYPIELIASRDSELTSDLPVIRSTEPTPFR